MQKLSRMVASLALLLTVFSLSACEAVPMHPKPSENQNAALKPETLRQSLQNSWQAYRDRFIQGDGRVIDHQALAITTSEGQAYALLRSLWANDPDTFRRVLTWSQNNLRVRGDALWAWKWGQKPDGAWTVLDTTAASDADIDTAMAMLLAADRWKQPDYHQTATAMLKDIWDKETLQTPWGRVLLPGDWDWSRLPENKASKNPRHWDRVRINPSYFSPVAFRLFAEQAGSNSYPHARDWEQLRQTSETILKASVPMSGMGMPADWVALTLPEEGKPAGSLAAAVGSLPKPLSMFGAEAPRVFWRYGMEDRLFGSSKAIKGILTIGSQRAVLGWQGKLNGAANPNPIAMLSGLLGANPNPGGNDTTTHAVYGASLLALGQTDPAQARAISAQLVLPGLRGEIPSSKEDYYAQNWLWLGLASEYAFLKANTSSADLVMQKLQRTVTLEP